MICRCLYGNRWLQGIEMYFGNTKTIAVIGAGAGGLAAAVTAGKKECVATEYAHAAGEKVHAAAGEAHAAGEDAHIIVYEATDKAGRSILASGNGRCNFSNSHILPDDYSNPEYVASVLANLGAATSAVASPPTATAPNPVVSFFEAHGMLDEDMAATRPRPLATQ